MKCPSCDVEMEICIEHGVGIDKCPHCHGVWLDRGELDKLVRDMTQRTDEKCSLVSLENEVILCGPHAPVKKTPLFKALLGL